MDRDRFDALTRTFAKKPSRRRAMAILGGALTAPLLGRPSASAQNTVPCPEQWSICNGRCIPPHHCCIDEDCRPGQWCWFGVCLGDETVCASDDDCPIWHICTQGECRPF